MKPVGSHVMEMVSTPAGALPSTQSCRGSYLSSRRYERRRNAIQIPLNNKPTQNRISAPTAKSFISDSEVASRFSRPHNVTFCLNQTAQCSRIVRTASVEKFEEPLQVRPAEFSDARIIVSRTGHESDPHGVTRLTRKMFSVTRVVDPIQV